MRLKSNTRRAFAPVIADSFSGDTPRNDATSASTSARFAGWFSDLPFAPMAAGVPPDGKRSGVSVSIRIWLSGTSRAAARTFAA